MDRGSVATHADEGRAGPGPGVGAEPADPVPAAITHRDLTWLELVAEAERLVHETARRGLGLAA